ncbi:MAG TPA: VOC family protein [Bacteroidota bacterium]|nr:VOC family protein [Bacteroidota bacterium]
MKRVTGIGGLFFKSKDPAALKRWYTEHLGIGHDKYGSVFTWRDALEPHEERLTVWSPFRDDTTYFGPSAKDFMFNYRVEDLKGLLELLKQEGVTVVGEVEEYEYGRFGWIMDPEGNKIELWEPVDGPLLENWRKRDGGESADSGGGGQYPPVGQS